MRPAQKRALLWQGVGWLCYFAGLALCLFTAVGVYQAAPSGSFENVTTADLAVLLGGVVLIVGGRTVAASRGGSPGTLAGSTGVREDREPAASKLEELGYHVPPADDERDSRFAYEGGDVLVVCGECGERNDGDFEFCRNCSSRLPE